MIKTNHTLIIILVFLYSQIPQAQNLEWASKLGGSYIDHAFDISKDRLGNIYLAGGFCNSVNFNPKGQTVEISAIGLNSSDNFFAKYDSKFILKWVIPIGTSSYEIGSQISIDSLFNVFVLGQAFGIVDLNPSANDFLLDCTVSNSFIAKYDSFGEFLNGCTVPSINMYPPNSKLFIDSQNYVFVYSNDTLLKYDNNLKLLWSKPISGQPQMDSKGNFYAIKNFKSPFYNTNFSQNELTMYKYDNNGNTKLIKKYAHTLGFISGGFIRNILNNVNIISGKFWGILTFYGNNDSLSVTNNDMGATPTGMLYPLQHEFIAEFDSLNNILWAKAYTGKSPEPYIIEPDKNGNVYTLGSINFNANFDPNGEVIISNNGFENYIAKYDSDFRYKAVTKFLGGSYNDFIGNFKLYNDTALICGHFFNTINLALSNSNYYLTASPPEDIFVAEYSVFDIRSTPLQIDGFKNKLFAVVVSPNPSNGIYNLELQKITNSSFISIFNINGEKIISKKLDSNFVTIDISDKTAGLYYAVLNQGKEKACLSLLKTQ